jgi:hypothetical protein
MKEMSVDSSIRDRSISLAGGFRRSRIVYRFLSRAVALDAKAEARHENICGVG